jgi:farnesyl diphosphate synthase
MALLQQSQQPLKDSSFAHRLRNVAESVEDALEHILPPASTRLHEAMRYSVLGGGKRLRSFLVVTCANLFEVSPSLAFKTAAALEIIHSYSLIHDDLPCMDNSDMRRGKPSCHKVFGETTAILAGDALIPLAFQTLSSLEISPESRLDLIHELSQVIGSRGLVAGQMMDLDLEGPQQSLEDLLELQRLKTGVLFGFAAEAGAILGKASMEERNCLKEYGLLLGQAFQMIDDWLDGCGNEKDTGKPLKQDTSKVTFLTLLGPSLLHEKASVTIQNAIDRIAPFQEKGAPLKEAALFTLNRDW